MSGEDVATVYKSQSDHKAQLDALLALLEQVFPSSKYLDVPRLMELVESGNYHGFVYFPIYMFSGRSGGR